MIRVLCPWPTCRCPQDVQTRHATEGVHCGMCRVWMGPEYIQRFTVSAADSPRYTPPMPNPLTPEVARLLELVNADPRPRGAIAAAAGMSPAQFSQILTGHRGNPTLATVAKILEVLGKSWKDLDPPKKPKGQVS